MSEMTDFIKRMAEQGTKVTGVGPGGAQCDIGINGDGEMTSNWSGDLTDLAEGENQSSGPKPFLEQAVDKAIYSLGEIISYAECGRPQGCLLEAREALDLIKILLAQHNETTGNAVPDQPVEAVDE